MAHTLNDCRILVVEDEFMIADELCLELEEAGAVVVGPVATVDEALSITTKEPKPDGAILDVNLGGTMSFAAADQLVADNIPFVFITGYDASSIPGRFSQVPLCEKPVSISKIVQAIGRVACA